MNKCYSKIRISHTTEPFLDISTYKIVVKDKTIQSKMALQIVNDDDDA